MNTATSSLPVVVAGGGIGGLAAALALVRQGFQVQVLEQAPEIGEIGARSGVPCALYANTARRYSHNRLRPALIPVAQSAVIARLRPSGVARTKRKSRGRTRQRQLRCYDGARPPFNSSMSDSVSRFTEVRRPRGGGAKDGG